MIDDHTFGAILAFLTIVSGTCAGVALIRRCRDKSERARWSVFHRSRNTSVFASSQQKVERKLPLRISDPAAVIPSHTSGVGTVANARRMSTAQRTHWSNDRDAAKSIPGTPTGTSSRTSFQLPQQLNSLVSRIGMVGANTSKEADVFEATVSKIDLSLPPPNVNSDDNDDDDKETSKTSVAPEYHKPESQLPPIKEDRSTESENDEEAPKKPPSPPNLPDKDKPNQD